MQRMIDYDLIINATNKFLLKLYIFLGEGLREEYMILCKLGIYMIGLDDNILIQIILKFFQEFCIKWEF
jgi:hypothetical protein